MEQSTVHYFYDKSRSRILPVHILHNWAAICMEFRAEIYSKNSEQPQRRSTGISQLEVSQRAAHLICAL
jgi:hypothetical protein